MSAVIVEQIEYIEGAGPGIPELPSELPDAAELRGETPPQVETFPGWQQEHFETFLLGLGSGVHMLIGQGESDWLMTKADLERIAPPMTRIANRWEPALRASAYADPILVGYGLTVWAWRSALERARAIRDRQEPEEGTPASARYERSTGDSGGPEAGAAADPQEEDEDGEGFQAVKPAFPQAAVPRLKR